MAEVTVTGFGTAPVQEALTLLSAASRLLLPAEAFEEALPAIAHLLVPAWADGCTIGLCSDGSTRIVASLGRPPSDDVASRRLPRPAISSRIDGEAWSLELAIAARGESLGFLWLSGPGEAPSTIMAGLADELALRIAIAIQTSRAIAREHHIAETLQRALLPEQLPKSPAIALDAAYRPATGESIVGGDWYDAFELPDGRIGVSIGDVAGHGLSAAVVMSEARQAVRASSFDARSPGEVLTRANTMLKAMPMMVTALVGIYDPKNSVFTYASAGHPSPLAIMPGGHAFMLPNGDLPLGVTDKLEPHSWAFTLQPGSMLVLYTDGIVEYGRDVLGGELELVNASVRELANPSIHPAQAIVDRVFGATPNPDDVATLTLCVPPRDPAAFDCVFSAVPFASPYVRRALERYLIAHTVDEDRRFSVITAVGEGVANAVEHAFNGTPGTVRVCVWFDEALVRVQIEDCGRWRPATRAEERGRGIPLMRALMDRVEIRTDRASTQIKMQLRAT